jgi:hypothetical protein
MYEEAQQLLVGRGVSTAIQGVFIAISFYHHRKP